MRRKSTMSKRVRGRGLMDWVTGTALPWLKKNKVISTLGNLAAPFYAPAGAVGDIAGSLGYGKRKRGRPRHTRRRIIIHVKGGAFSDVLKRGLSAVKKGAQLAQKHQLISRGANLANQLTGNKYKALGTVGDIAGALGFGKRRMRAPRRLPLMLSDPNYSHGGALGYSRGGAIKMSTMGPVPARLRRGGALGYTGGEMGGRRRRKKKL